MCCVRVALMFMFIIIGSLLHSLPHLIVAVRQPLADMLYESDPTLEEAPHQIHGLCMEEYGVDVTICRDLSSMKCL